MPRPVPLALLARVRIAVLMCGWLALSSVQAEELRIGGTGTALGTMRVLAEAYAAGKPDLHISVLPSMGSKGGIKAVTAGSLQIGVSSRPLSEAEAATGVTAIEYGRTPFVFAVASRQPVRGITTAQLVDFYAARTEQWPDGSRVRLVMRPVGDADSELVKNISPAMRQAHTAAEERKGMIFAVTDQESVDHIEKINGAIGTTTLAQILSEKRPVRALTLDGVAPDVRALADGRYVLHKPLYLVSGPAPTPATQGFIAFVRSAGGREILRQNGHWVP